MLFMLLTALYTEKFIGIPWILTVLWNATAMVLHSSAFHLKMCSIQSYDNILMNYRCLVGVAGGTQTSCAQPRNTEPPGYMPGYMSTYLAEVIYGKNCLRFSCRASGVKEPLLLFHRVHFLTFVSFRCMKRWFSVSVYFFMLVSQF